MLSSSNPSKAAFTDEQQAGVAQYQQELPDGFDLGLSVAMAAAAFEAYLEPTGAAFKEVSLNQTETTYTCKSFLREAFDGILELTVEGAKGLKAVNLPIAGPGSDPYVVVTCADSAGRTQVKWKTTEAFWGETFRLFVRDASKDILRLRVFDKNNIITDVDLGAAAVPVAALQDGQLKRMDVPLRGANGQGTVAITARFLPFAGADGPGGAAEALLEAAAVDLEPVAAVPADGGGAAEAAGGEAAEGGAEDGGGAGVEAAAADEGLVVSEAVQQASKSAVDTIEGVAGKLQEQLVSAGVDDKVVEALGSVKQAALDRARLAADSVTGFVERQGIGSLPAKDLTKILVAISSASAASEASGSDADGAAGGLSLSPEQLPGAWKALAQVAGKALEDVFEAVAFVENGETDTQVWISRSASEREVVVAFRGTEQVKWKDFVSDANLIPQTLDVERTGAIDLGIGSIPVPFKSFKKSQETMVHSGFLNAYDSVKVKVLTLVDQLTAGASPERPWRVFVTGHSLGGALATLCAYELTGRTPKTGPGSLEVSMYTFGAPRVGNLAFARAFDERMRGRSWRITNASDIVPSVPRLMGYSHVRTGVRLATPPRNGGGGGDGSSTDGAPAAAAGHAALLFEDTSQDCLGEGREVAEVLSDLASKALRVAQGEVPVEGVVDAIRDHEMALLNALMDGSALSQHMEDFYLLTLREALLAVRPDLQEEVAAALSQQRLTPGGDE